MLLIILACQAPPHSAVRDSDTAANVADTSADTADTADTGPDTADTGPDTADTADTADEPRSDCDNVWDYSSAPSGPPVFVEVSAGPTTTCGVLLTGELWCWGETRYWDQPAPPRGRFHEVSQVYGSACAIDDQDRAVCWGSWAAEIGTIPCDYWQQFHGTAWGAMGLLESGLIWGSTEHLGAPTATFERIASGVYGTCGRDRDGVLTCVNLLNYGTFERPPEDPVLDYDYNSFVGCAVLAADRSLVCWGGEDSGGYEALPTAMFNVVPPPGEFVAVAVDMDYACAVSVDGSMRCFSAWEDPKYNWPYPWEDTGRPFSPAGNDWVDVDVESNNACGLHADGRIECWGDNSYGQMDGPN